MTRRTDALGPLTREEVADLMEQAERLHALDIRWVLVTLAAIVAFFVLCGEASGSLAAFPLFASNCTGRCRQGRDCTCARMEQRSGGGFVNTDQMLLSGTMTGPHRRTRPITLSLRQRLLRALRSLFTTRSPL